MRHTGKIVRHTGKKTNSCCSTSYRGPENASCCPERNHRLRRDAPCWFFPPLSWGPLYTPPGQNAGLSPSSPARLVSIVFAVPEIPLVRHRRADFGRTDRSVLLDTFFSSSFRYMEADPVTPYQVDPVPYKSDPVPYKSDLVPYYVGFYR